jgi:hypothetical protein
VSSESATPLSPFDGEGTACHHPPLPVASRPALSYSCSQDGPDAQMKLSIPARPQKRPPTPNPPYRQPPSALQNPRCPPACMLKKTSPKKTLQIHCALSPTLLRTVERLSMHPAANRFPDTLYPKRKLHASAPCTPNPSITHELVLVFFACFECPNKCPLEVCISSSGLPSGRSPVDTCCIPLTMPDPVRSSDACD